MIAAWVCLSGAKRPRNFSVPQSVDCWEMEANQTCTLTPLNLSDLCAQYLRDRFQFKLNAHSSHSISVATMPPFPPLMLLILLTSRLDRIALTLVDAFLNRSECICETFSTSYSETLNSRCRLGCCMLCRKAPQKASKFRNTSCNSY
jgi:hypothetical protein